MSAIQPSPTDAKTETGNWGELTRQVGEYVTKFGFNRKGIQPEDVRQVLVFANGNLGLSDTRRRTQPGGSGGNRYVSTSGNVFVAPMVMIDSAARDDIDLRTVLEAELRANGGVTSELVTSALESAQWSELVNAADPGTGQTDRATVVTLEIFEEQIRTSPSTSIFEKIFRGNKFETTTVSVRATYVVDGSINRMKGLPDTMSNSRRRINGLNTAEPTASATGTRTNMDNSAHLNGQEDLQFSDSAQLSGVFQLDIPREPGDVTGQQLHERTESMRRMVDPVGTIKRLLRDRLWNSQASALDQATYGPYQDDAVSKALDATSFTEFVVR